MHSFDIAKQRIEFSNGKYTLEVIEEPGIDKRGIAKIYDVEKNRSVSKTYDPINWTIEDKAAAIEYTIKNGNIDPKNKDIIVATYNGVPYGVNTKIKTAFPRF